MNGFRLGSTTPVRGEGQMGRRAYVLSAAAAGQKGRAREKAGKSQAIAPEAEEYGRGEKADE